MSGRKWCPDNWLDEFIPTLCDDPSGFIVPTDGGWRLRPTDWDESQEGWDQPLEPGQIVDFCYTEDRGTVVVSFEADGSWRAVTPVPSASHFWVFEPDGPLGDTLDDLMDMLKSDGWFDDVGPGEHEIGAYYWSHAFSFRFDGARFVPCLEDTPTQ
ncbi:hypothetical protein DYI37_03995 [Fulvimarina endophytica]|uniref:Uncharacterized protein n=1 Tax=Fulvimarina endophytica TaxID=2293836 RepID=A0A371X750_9HYPH|nr:hypothetical protein [Fulvimarina endophytica]RFC65036.1 hypothetical protein DYI37_03995 [Fulvimarina endophytica]